MMLPILYSFRRCPFAMRARIALLVSGTAFEIREILLRDKPEAMIAASPKATVPVLVLHDGQVIDESLDIMHWALNQNDPEQWLEGHDAALVATFDDRFKHHLDRYKYPDRHGTDPVEHRAAGLALLHRLDARLSTSNHLDRNTRAFTDIALMPFVRQFAAVDRRWFEAQPIPQVHRWLTDLIASPLFEQAMIRLKPWQPTDAPILISGTDVIAV